MTLPTPQGQCLYWQNLSEFTILLGCGDFRTVWKISRVCCLIAHGNFLEVVHANCGLLLPQVALNPYTCACRHQMFFHYHCSCCFYMMTGAIPFPCLLPLHGGKCEPPFPGLSLLHSGEHCCQPAPQWAPSSWSPTPSCTGNPCSLLWWALSPSLVTQPSVLGVQSHSYMGNPCSYTSLHSTFSLH